MTHILTIKQFVEKHPAFTEAGLRALIFERKFNGFEVAMRRLGRRVYLSEPDFFEWLEKRGPGASTTRRLRAERHPRPVAVLEHTS